MDARDRKYIYRVEGPAPYWIVKFTGTEKDPRTSARKRYVKSSKIFSDMSHLNNKLISLRAAKEWRDTQLATQPELKKQALRNKERYNTIARSNTGVVGIHKSIRKGRRPCFCVTWCETEKGQRVRKEKRFYISGDEALVFERACDFRKEKERQHYIGQVE